MTGNVRIASSFAPGKPGETEVSLSTGSQVEEKLGLGNHHTYGVCRQKGNKQGDDGSRLFHGLRAPTMIAAILDQARCFPQENQGHKHHPLFVDEETGLRQAM